MKGIAINVGIRQSFIGSFLLRLVSLSACQLGLLARWFWQELLVHMAEEFSFQKLLLDEALRNPEIIGMKYLPLKMYRILLAAFL